MIENSISIVLPCFNESEAIQQTLGRLVNRRQLWLKEKTYKQVDIIVVDDGSTDDSQKKLHEFAQNIRVLSLPKQSGYGAALKYGFKSCSTKWLAFYDLDQTCDPDDLPRMTALLGKSKAQLALGNRLSRRTRMPLHRRFGNLIFRSTVNILHNSQLSDVCTGYRVFENQYKNLFTTELPNDLNYSLAMTIVALKANLKLVELDVNYNERAGRSKLNSIYHGVQFIKTIFQFTSNSRTTWV